MSLPEKYRPSLEAIAYQGQSMLFKELTVAFDEIVKASQSQGKLSKSYLEGFDLGKMIKHHTGLNVNVIFDSEVNAYAQPPILDQNSPLLARWKTQFDISAFIDEIVTSRGKLSSYSKSTSGEIDLKKSRVKGLFAQIPLTICVGDGLWQRAGLSGEEVAAVTLHEVGHLFTFLETLVNTVSTNCVLIAAAEALGRLEERTERLTLVHETAKALDIKVEKPEQLADGKKEQFYTVLLRAGLERHVTSALGSSSYDMRNSEFLADQFANRHGAGRALAVGLDKMMRTFSAIGEYRSNAFVFHLVTVLKFAGMVILLALQGGAFSIAALLSVGGLVALFLSVTYMVLANPEAQEYDLPIERLERVRRDMIQAMKNPKLPPTLRKRLNDDVEALATLIGDAKDHRTLLNYIWISLTPTRRKQFSQMRFQQELERLTNNELFAKASKLQTLV